MNELQKAVTANPSIQNIYFNDAGQYIFFANPLFSIVKSRADVLAVIVPPVQVSEAITT